MSKQKKIIGIVSSVLVVIILVFVVMITLSIILSSGKNYTSLFGKAYVSVLTDSMEGVYDESFPYEVKGFKQGDLIQIRILDPGEKTELKQGDVITYEMDEQGTLNTHRIIMKEDNGISIKYTTQGDNPDAIAGNATEEVWSNKVVGVYTGHRIAGLGKAVDFFHSQAGFFVCIVLPSLLIVAYFAYNLVVTVKSVKNAYKEEDQQNEEEKMREKILQELREQGKIKEEDASAAAPEETPAESPSNGDTAE